MRYPRLSGLRTQRLVTNAFRGYRHTLEEAEGCFFDTQNLTTERFPLLSTREKRGVVRTLTNPGGLLEKDALAFVDNGTLYYNGLATAVTGLTPGKKQLVSMGAYVCIFPDKVYYNTEDSSDYGSMEASYTSSGTVSLSLCRADGSDYESIVRGDTEPEDTSTEVWICTAGGTTVAMSYSAASGGWVELGTVYTKITFSDTAGNIPRLFKEGDGVSIDGAEFDELNGEKILTAVGGESGENGWIVVVGLLESATTQSAALSISRSVPEMDFVCEAQNRLWGCFYGASGTQVLNEIYCCALGDFKNWRQYRGFSTDSWTASVGSDGQWTGAVNYLGSPVFFKENRIHQVNVSSVGAHQIQETVCRGVQKGSEQSLVVVNETLYYKSREDVCAWQGGFPQGVSEALGGVRYAGAAGGALDGRYYLSMQDEDSDWHLFVYDITRGLWCREDDLHALCFARVDSELYAVDAGSGALLALRGTQGTVEADLSWSAETAVQTWEVPDRKYLSRYDIRLKLGEGASAAVYLEYDSSGTWIPCGTIVRAGLGSTLLPVRPRRCDHLRMRISGTGEAEILSIARVLEVGSDI